MPISDTGFWVDVDVEHEHAFDPSLAAAIRDLARKEGVRTLYDFGCGMGQYVKTFRAGGIEASGYDGNPLTTTFANCSVADLTDSSFVRPPVDCVVCLEVGEHVPAEYESALLQTIDRHVRPGGLLILSWAIPGQGGLGHVNCKTNADVRERITQLGYTACLDLDQRLRSASTLGWFKNTLLVFRKFPLVHTDLSGGFGNQLFTLAALHAQGYRVCFCEKSFARAPLSPLFDGFPRTCSGGPFVPAPQTQRGSEALAARELLLSTLPLPPDPVDAVFLHVRGGDYVGHPLHHVPLASYYERAVRHFPPGTLFHVVTNDPAYAEQVLPQGIRYEMLELDDADAFQHMRACHLGGICANSSFSWWAAVLSPSRPIVIPSRWTNSIEWNQSSDYRLPGASVEEVGVDAYCIHLPHRTDRMASIARMQTRYPWLQVHLVDAVHVPEAGWKGCLRSHQAIVQSAKEARLPYVLVLEDDCEFQLESEDLKRALLAAMDYAQDAPVISGCGNLTVFDGVSVVGQRDALRFLKAPDVRTTHCILYAASSYDRILALQETDEIDVQLNACGLVFTYPYLATQASSYSDIKKEDVSYDNIERSRAFVKNLLEPPRLHQDIQQPVNLRPVFRIPIRTKRV